MGLNYKALELVVGLMALFTISPNEHSNYNIHIYIVMIMMCVISDYIMLLNKQQCCV